MTQPERKWGLGLAFRVAVNTPFQLMLRIARVVYRNSLELLVLALMFGIWCLGVVAAIYLIWAPAIGSSASHADLGTAPLSINQKIKQRYQPMGWST